MFAFLMTSTETKNLDSVDFRAQLKNSKSSWLIDVSTREEHEELHIPGSSNFDALSGDFIDRIDCLDKSKPYFIYCRDGSRSKSACILMEELGFKRIFHLTSGIKDCRGTLERSF